MALLICAATAKELRALAPAFFPVMDAIEEMRPMGVMHKRRQLIFLATGTGPINAALAIGYCFGITWEKSQMESHETIDAVLYAGLAGAFDLRKTPLCSIWRVSEEIWPEYGLNDGHSVTARAFSFPLWARKEGDIYDRAPLAPLSALHSSPSVDEELWPACASLTVAGVSASFNRAAQLWGAYGAPLENMEGFAAAYACLRAEKPCVEIRVISNKVGPRSRDEKDFDGALKALGRVLPELNII